MDMENYGDECDWPINTTCDSEDFWAHKVGRVRCPKCGTVVLPCNECAAETPLGERDCGNCPWSNAEILEENS